MDLAWGEHFWREDVSHPVHHEGCFSGLLRIHRRVGRKRELHEGVREREGDSRPSHQARDIETDAVTAFPFCRAPLALGLPENCHESNGCRPNRYRMCTFSVLYRLKLAHFGSLGLAAPGAMGLGW